MLLWVNSIPDKCCVFNCRSNYDNGPKETVFSFLDEENDYGLRQRLIRFVNRKDWKPPKKSCICREHFEPRYYKTGAQGKRYRLAKKLKPVPTIFDPEESHFSVESKHLKSPVSIPRNYQQNEFINKISLSYWKKRAKSKVLMILILR